MAIRYHIEQCGYRFGGRRAASLWIRECTAREGKTPEEVNIIFCSDDYLLDINRRFLGHDYYTDVITFQYEGAPGEINGDIYISVDTVAANASAYGQAPLREMYRVIIHGILHLCGYGDKTEEEEKTMHEKEDSCLALLPR